MRLPSQELLLAQLTLVDLVHVLDQRHLEGLEPTPHQLWQLAVAAAEVSRLQGRPWLLEDISAQTRNALGFAPSSQGADDAGAPKENENSAVSATNKNRQFPDQGVCGGGQA